MTKQQSHIEKLFCIIEVRKVVTTKSEWSATVSLKMLLFYSIATENTWRNATDKYTLMDHIIVLLKLIIIIQSIFAPRLPEQRGLFFLIRNG